MLIRHTVIYGLARLVPGLGSLGLIAFITRFMTPEAVGIYFLVYATVMVTHGLTMVWFNMSVQRLLTKSDDADRLLGNVLGMYLGVLALVLAGCALALPFVQGAEDRRLLLIGAGLYATYSWFELVCQVMAARLEAERRLSISVIRTLIATGLGAGLAWAGYGPEGLLVGAILGHAIPGLIVYWQDWRALTLRIDRAVGMEFAAFGLPLAVSFSMGAISYATDRFMVTWMEGVAVLGLYVVGFELAQRIVQTVTQPVGLAALPLVINALEQRGAKAARDQLQSNLALLVLLSAPVAFGLICVTPDFVTVTVGEDFRAMTMAVLPVIALAQFLLGIQHHFVDHSFHLGMKTAWHGLIQFVAVGTNIIANYVLIQQFGAIGAAYGTLIAALAALALGTLMSGRSFKLPPMPPAVLPIGLSTLAMIAAVLAVPLEPSVLGLIVKGAVGGLVYGAVILAFDVQGIRSKVVDILAKRRGLV